MKLNLYDLEHDSRAAPVASCPSDHLMCMPPHGCAATRLALIARIRELETMLYSVLSDENYLADVPALIEKGAVLP